MNKLVLIFPSFALCVALIVASITGESTSIRKMENAAAIAALGNPTILKIKSSQNDDLSSGHRDVYTDLDGDGFAETLVMRDEKKPTQARKTSSDLHPEIRISVSNSNRKVHRASPRNYTIWKSGGFTFDKEEYLTMQSIFPDMTFVEAKLYPTTMSKKVGSRNSGKSTNRGGKKHRH